MAGGFKFGKASVTYDSTTYPTKRDWALAVHKARCQALMNAAYASLGGIAYFARIQTGISEITDTVHLKYGTHEEDVTIYIQDLHPTSADTGGAYPAFVSYFRVGARNDSPEYCIITSNGFHGKAANSQDYTKGLYVNAAKLVCNGNIRYRYYPKNLAHAFAKNGFGSYDVGSSNVSQGETSVCNCFNTDGNQAYDTGGSGSSNTANSNDGMVYNPTNGRTYTFGYAVKYGLESGSMIEAFYRVSNYDQNMGWLWCIIGEIFDNNCIGNAYPVGALKIYRGSMTETGSLTASTTTDYSNVTSSQVIKSDGGRFPADSMPNMTSIRPVIMPSFIPNRCNSNTPDELIYAAACVGYGGASYTNTLSSDGIDGNGNCVKGYIKTDLLRMVSFLATKIGGTTYQGGNFVVPCNCGAVQNNMDFGIILGWDPSNESIL